MNFLEAGSADLPVSSESGFVALGAEAEPAKVALVDLVSAVKAPHLCFFSKLSSELKRDQKFLLLPSPTRVAASPS